MMHQISLSKLVRSMMLCCSLLLVATLVSGEAQASSFKDYKKGIAAFKAQNFADAHTYLAPLAGGRRSHVLIYLAVMHRAGLGGEKNEAKATELLDAATAKLGAPEVNYMLGKLHSDKEHALFDKKTALAYAQRSAAGGSDRGVVLLEELTAVPKEEKAKLKPAKRVKTGKKFFENKKVDLKQVAIDLIRQRQALSAIKDSEERAGKEIEIYSQLTKLEIIELQKKYFKQK